MHGGHAGPETDELIPSAPPMLWKKFRSNFKTDANAFDHILSHTGPIKIDFSHTETAVFTIFKSALRLDKHYLNIML